VAELCALAVCGEGGAMDDVEHKIWDLQAVADDLNEIAEVGPKPFAIGLPYIHGEH
jgi:hypothetical protein